MDHTCACNNLTSFECEAQAPENGNYVNLQKIGLKIRESTLGRTYFWGVLAI